MNSYRLHRSFCRIAVGLGLIFLVIGCKTFAEPDPYVVLNVPTPLSGSGLSDVGTVGEVLPPQVEVAVEAVENGEGEVRPTWTPLPGATPDCSQPAGWVAYSVEKGNTLSAIAKWSGSTVAKLAEVNCIDDPTRIEIAQRIYVPREILPTSTPTLAPTETATPTAILTVEPAMMIDFLYVEQVDAELVIRWQVVGQGDYQLTWADPEKEVPVLLNEGGQGEYTLGMPLPDNAEYPLIFTLTAIRKNGSEVSQSVEFGHRCVDGYPAPEDGCDD